MRNEERVADYIKTRPFKNILLLLPLIGISIFVRAQSPDTVRTPKWAICQLNPLGLLVKERIKVEARLNPTNSISLAYTKFYTISSENQLFAEYRHYNRGTGKAEFFIYGKAGIGAGTTHGFETGNEYGPYQYLLAGGGVGWHVSIGKKEHIFFDISMGLKYSGVYSVTDNSGSGDPSTTFYLFGSGSVLDISSCFGWQFR